MNEAASNLIEQLRPGYEADAASLRAEFPSCRFSISSHSNLALSCLFPEAPHDMPDNIALVVNFVSAAGFQRVMADITWDHPSGHIEDSIPHEWLSSDDWPVLTPEVAAWIVTDMPRLRASFRQAVTRGTPPSSGSRTA